MKKMNEERMNPNFDLESCLRNKVNEAKIYLEDKNKRQKDEPCEESSYAESFIYYFQNVETILDLYKQEKEKNGILQKELDQKIEALDKAMNNPDYISKDKIKDMQRYREFELQQQYKEFKDDIEWQTYNKILEED